MSLNLSKPFTDGTPNITSKASTPSMDKAKEWQRELLMEKLRSKGSQFKTFAESAKALRMALLEKRYPVDSLERSQLQKCLDTLQNSIKVTSLHGMVERLESVSRQLGLKFMAGGSGPVWFISSDMFYLEIELEPSGDVKDVKIQHDGLSDPQSCEELVSCLSRRDFSDFAAQLEGLAGIYQLNAEKKIKSKALVALQSLETDLVTLASLESWDAASMLSACPVGVLYRRRGGHAMRLTYLTSPYDLLDPKKKQVFPLTVDEINTRNLGYSVTVCIEGSAAHKLQIAPIVSAQRGPNGMNVAVYAPLQGTNCAHLPGCFVLRLKEPLPMCVSLVKMIEKVTGMEFGDLSNPRPLLSLITEHASNGLLDCSNNRGLYVTLPDETHCYYMTENKGLVGVLVTSIPFTHPEQVPNILNFLRQQALFNTVITSCVRPNSRQDVENVVLLEVTALSWQQLSVSLEHPLEEGMATLELNLCDSSNIVCKLCSSGKTVTPEYPSKVMQKCLSIPVTMRALMRLWRNQSSYLTNGLSNGNGNYGMLGSDGTGPGPGPGSGSMGDLNHGPADLNGLRHGQIKMEPGEGGGSNGSGGAHMDATTYPPFNSPMLIDPFGSSGATHGQKKSRKRKAAEGLWRSPKAKSSEDCEILVESSSNDSTPLGTPTSRDAPVDFRMSTPTSVEFPNLTDEGKFDPATAAKAMSTFEEEAAEDEIEEMDDVEMLKVLPRKAKKEKRSPPPPPPPAPTPATILLDIAEGKTMVPPSVSITPINSSSPSPSLNSVLGLDRRPGIEIIPLGTPAPTSLPSSITITPITSSPGKSMSDDRSRKSREKDEEKARLEKKRKRKREDSPMGPPDKLPPKQDPLSKPISVSIKATDSPPMSMSSRPASPVATMRKYSSSPTHTSPLALTHLNKSASSPGSGSLSKKQSTHSPKHSPAYSTSSPKHMLSSSPKHHSTGSPKHQNSGSSGKPSVSTLKSATISPSSSGKSSSGELKSKSSSSSSSSSTSKESSRDKDRSRSSSSGSGGHSSPKPKVSSGKTKPSDLSSPTEGAGAGAGAGASTGSTSSVGGGGVSGAQLAGGAGQSSGTLTPPPGSQDGKSPVLTAPIRNRKSSLSAVIDKLTAQHTTGEEEGGRVGGGGCGVGESVSSGKGDRTTLSSKTGEVKGTSSSGKPGDSTKNPGEYMIKSSSSQDGIKLTINKTRTKDSSMRSSSGVSKSSSPKAHSGIRPGVNSSNPGVVKKLSPSLQKLSSSSSAYSSSSSKTSSSSSSSLSKALSSTQKSGSPYSTAYSKSGTPKSSGSPKMGMSSSSSSSSSTSSSKQRMTKGSPSSSSSSADSPRSFKMIPGKKDHGVIPELTKSLDTNFQIPKLSARASNLNFDSDPTKKAVASSDKSAESSSKSNPTVEPAAKVLDLNKSDSNSPLSKYSTNAAPTPPSSTPPPIKSDDKSSPIAFLKSGSNPLTSGHCPSPKLSIPSPLSAKIDSKGANENSPLPGVTITSIGPADDTSCETQDSRKTQSSLSKDDSSLGKIVTLKELVDMRSSSPLDVSKKSGFDAGCSAPSVSDSGSLDPLLVCGDRLGQNTPQEAAELLLDFSAASASSSTSSSSKSGATDPSVKKMIMSERIMTGLSPCRNTPPPQPIFPSSPSLTMHIVKSPSTLISPSPTSGSPCITDDDLMDEALVGMGK